SVLADWPTSFFGLLREITQEMPTDSSTGVARGRLSGIYRSLRSLRGILPTAQGLRSSTLETNDLAEAIGTLAKELAANVTGPNVPAFRLDIGGAPQSLHPILRDEVYRIGGEALRNAFRHAEAGHVEVEIQYEDKRFRVRVRDDGKGIDPAVLAGEGREGHYGLHGMRERAKLIGAKLGVWSDVAAGTEVELTIPASIAYAGSRRRSWLSERLSGKGTAMKS